MPLGVVVIDRHYDVRLLNRAARNLLSIHGVALGEDLIHLTKAVPPLPLRALIDQAFRAGPEPVSAELAAEDPLTGLPRSLSFRALPHHRASSGARPELVMVVIQDVTALAQIRQALEQQLQQSQADLERIRQEAAEAVAEREELLEVLRTSNRQLSENNYDLTRVVEDLHITAQQFQVRTEEAQAVSEEAETLNEELQATNEELATLNEEIQATNEELQATNEELRSRSQDLEALLEERETERVRVSALLHSVQDAVALIGSDGQAVLSNTAFRALVGDAAALLLASDASGQPLPKEATPLAQAARGEVFSLSFTLPDSAGSLRWFEAHGEPIRDAAGQPLGGVLVLHARDAASA